MINIIILLPVSIKIMKRKIKQRWSAISTISTKRTSLYSLNTQKTKNIYADENQGPFLGEGQHCGSVNLELFSIILSFFTSLFFYTIFLIFYRKIFINNKCESILYLLHILYT